MPSLFTDPVLQIWTYNDADSERMIKKFLEKGMDKYSQNKSKILSKMTRGDDISAPVVRWLEEWGYPGKITAQLTGGNTLTISGKLFGKDVDEELIKRVIRVGTILERCDSSEAQIKVTSIAGIEDGSPYQATVAAYGGTTPTNDSAAVEWDIISEVWRDTRDAEQPRALNRQWLKVGTQIHAETFEIPKTMENTSFEVIENPAEHNITELIEKMARQLEKAVVRSRPYHDGSNFVYGDSVEEPTMCGLRIWPIMCQTSVPNPDVYVDASGAPITKTMLDNLIRNMWITENVDFNNGDWWILCDPNVHSDIQDFDMGFRRMEYDDETVGMRVNVFDSKIGKSFPIMSDIAMKPGEILIVNFANAKYGYYAKDKMDRKEIATQGRYRRWLISFQTYGVVMRKPRHIGMIYNLATS